MNPQDLSSFNALAIHALSRHGDRVAFIDDDGTETTYAAARVKVGRLMTALAVAGVGPGSAVAGLGLNRSELYLSELAVALLGGRYAGLHVLASPAEHALVCDGTASSSTSSSTPPSAITPPRSWIGRPL